jgi:hypothetical protein
MATAGMAAAGWSTGELTGLYIQTRVRIRHPAPRSTTRGLVRANRFPKDSRRR